MGARDRGLLPLGVVAVVRALWLGDGTEPDVPAAAAGEPVVLRLEDLSGPEWRLLPGVGPVLAERLEQARRAAGGALTEVQADAVAGVGPALLARWRAVRPAGPRGPRPSQATSQARNDPADRQRPHRPATTPPTGDDPADR